MQGDEDRVSLGFPPNSRPTLSQISEAYTCLQTGRNTSQLDFEVHAAGNFGERTYSVSRSQGYKLLLQC
uniref:Uncharacterized protein n=1 Tax=Salix viminalis TaxID=40686 RepID=A0A6N2MWT6_SALVM